MPSAERERLLAKIETFAARPTAGHGFAKRLTGSGSVRLRQKDWRALLAPTVDGWQVVAVGHRREIYR